MEGLPNSVSVVDGGTLARLAAERVLIFADPNDATDQPTLVVREGWPIRNGLYGGIGHVGILGERLLAPGVVCPKTIEFDLYYVACVLVKLVPPNGGRVTIAPSPILCEDASRPWNIDSQSPFLLVPLEERKYFEIGRIW